MNLFDPLTRLLRPDADARPSSSLAEILGVGVTDLAALRFGPRYHYRPLTVAKRDGRPRHLLAPSPALKTLQRRLLDNHLTHLPIHPCATAFRRGGSVVDHVRRHARQALIATVDIADFFSATRAARVRGFFARQGWRGTDLHVLMCLCVYRDGLPQGAPTSPCLSNLVNADLDGQLDDMARRTGAIYSRYADDLAFSWPTNALPGGFREAVEDPLHRAGYAIQPLKGWQVCPLRDRPCVCGLVLSGDGRVRLPWRGRWRLWYARWQSWWTGDAASWARRRGHEGYAHLVCR